VPRTQDRMWHDVGLPTETVALRNEVRRAVEERIAPYAREIGQAEESLESFPWKAFRGWPTPVCTHRPSISNSAGG
jgi:hypothetical protein